LRAFEAADDLFEADQGFLEVRLFGWLGLFYGS
jgi:hypothetical protein